MEEGAADKITKEERQGQDRHSKKTNNRKQRKGRRTEQ
jgi:hypothetical protein